MDAIVSAINTLDAMVWGPPMILLLLGTHIYMTVRTGFIQRKLPTAIKLSITKDPDAEGDISQFGALTTALSATIGTGNIVGVATAIMAGADHGRLHGHRVGGAVKLHDGRHRVEFSGYSYMGDRSCHRHHGRHRHLRRCARHFERMRKARPVHGHRVRMGLRGHHRHEHRIRMASHVSHCGICV